MSILTGPKSTTVTTSIIFMSSTKHLLVLQGAGGEAREGKRKRKRKERRSRGENNNEALDWEQRQHSVYKLFLYTPMKYMNE